MKISWNFEQSENEFIEQKKQTATTVNNAIDKVLTFGERFLNMLAQDKAASQKAYEAEQVSSLTRAVEMLNSKIDRLEVKVNSNFYKNSNFCKNNGSK